MKLTTTTTPAINCFLVDDDLDDQEIFCMALSGLGDRINCIYANDGVHAMEKLSNLSLIPDFIFIDMNMPRMNGLQCLKEIRKIARFNHTPVYMYSTAADPKTIIESRMLGANDFIVKPTNIADLTTALAGIFVRGSVYH
jgi:CheY-like chemotaxis protein